MTKLRNHNITCIPFRAVLDYCMECQKIVPYVNGYCFYCDSSSPVGEPHDYDISDNYWMKQYISQIQTICEINQNNYGILSKL